VPVLFSLFVGMLEFNETTRRTKTKFDLSMNILRRETFQTEEGIQVPAVTAAEMSEVDRLAVEEFGLGLLQMMENAGRNLAHLAIRRRNSENTAITVLSGGGGNGGGGLCAARHLVDHGWSVKIILDREPGELEGAAARQLNTLLEGGFEVENWKGEEQNSYSAPLNQKQIIYQEPRKLS